EQKAEHQAAVNVQRTDRGVSTEDLSFSAGALYVEGSNIDGTELGGQLARAVLQHEKAEHQAAIIVQRTDRGVSTDDLSLSAGALYVEGSDIHETELGGHLARAVLQQQKAGHQAAINVQRTDRGVSTEDLSLSAGALYVEGSDILETERSRHLARAVLQQQKAEQQAAINVQRTDRGVSTEDLSLSAGALYVEGSDIHGTELGGQLARAVQQQQKAEQQAAINVQRTDRGVSTEDLSFSAGSLYVEGSDIHETELGGQLARAVLQHGKAEHQAAINVQRTDRGVSTEDLSLSTGALYVEGSDIHETELGGQLARAVLQHEKAEHQAAIHVQRTWRKMKAQVHPEKRFAYRNVDLVNEKRERGAMAFQRAWVSAQFRKVVAAMVEKTAIRITIERDAAGKKLQRYARRRRDARELAARFAVRKIILEQAKSLQETNSAATIIQIWYCNRRELYYGPMRIVARYQLARKRKAVAKEACRRSEEGAATVIQLAWRKISRRIYLSNRFEARRAKMAREKEAVARARGVLAIQGWWRRIGARGILKERFEQRARSMANMVEEEERTRVEDASSRVLQQAWTNHCEWKVLEETRALEESKRLELEFYAKETLELEKRMQREHEATKAKLLEVISERDRKAEEAASHLMKAWKLGYDKKSATNYWFNHVTGESTTTKPEGWTIKPSERWIKHMDENGLVYYLDLETSESHWFPPCEHCHEKEGERTCKDCGDQVYCESCWTRAHESERMADHKWKGADSGKDDLQPGERCCVDCEFRKAKWVCLQCKDALCQECNARIHGSGHRKNHNIQPFAQVEKGWQTVEGRAESKPTSYFNATTNESTIDKLQELMLPDELFEHQRFLMHEATSERYVKQIENLQLQVEELMHEKDNIALQWANAQKDMKMNESWKNTGSFSLTNLALLGKKIHDGAQSPRTQEQNMKMDESRKKKTGSFSLANLAFWGKKTDDVAQSPRTQEQDMKMDESRKKKTGSFSLANLAFWGKKTDDVAQSPRTQEQDMKMDENWKNTGSFSLTNLALLGKKTHDVAQSPITQEQDMKIDENWKKTGSFSLTNLALLGKKTHDVAQSPITQEQDMKMNENWKNTGNFSLTNLALLGKKTHDVAQSPITQ
ncbi:unnamed protein product, partial [Ascophyllum nodosum]